MQTKIYFLIQCNIQILWQLITKIIKYLNTYIYDRIYIYEEVNNVIKIYYL